MIEFCLWNKIWAVWNMIEKRVSILSRVGFKEDLFNVGLNQLTNK